MDTPSQGQEEEESSPKTTHKVALLHLLPPEAIPEIQAPVEGYINALSAANDTKGYPTEGEEYFNTFAEFTRWLRNWLHRQDEFSLIENFIIHHRTLLEEEWHEADLTVEWENDSQGNLMALYVHTKEDDEESGYLVLSATRASTRDVFEEDLYYRCDTATPMEIFDEELGEAWEIKIPNGDRTTLNKDALSLSAGWRKTIELETESHHMDSNITLEVKCDGFMEMCIYLSDIFNISPEHINALLNPKNLYTKNVEIESRLALLEKASEGLKAEGIVNEDQPDNDEHWSFQINPLYKRNDKEIWVLNIMHIYDRSGKTCSEYFGSITITRHSLELRKIST
ncbi:MAG: hypothetical protein WC882_04505 [Candidatus Gracilibacteria bacterium]